MPASDPSPEGRGGQGPSEPPGAQARVWTSLRAADGSPRRRRGAARVGAWLAAVAAGAALIGAGTAAAATRSVAGVWPGTLRGMYLVDGPGVPPEALLILRSAGATAEPSPARVPGDAQDATVVLGGCPGAVGVPTAILHAWLARRDEVVAFGCSLGALAADIGVPYLAHLAYPAAHARSATLTPAALAAFLRSNLAGVPGEPPAHGWAALGYGHGCASGFVTASAAAPDLSFLVSFSVRNDCPGGGNAQPATTGG